LQFPAEALMAVEDILLISAQYLVTEKANFWPDALQWEMHLGIYSNQTTGTRSLHGTVHSSILNTI